MAGVSPAADQATDLLQKLSLDAQPKPLEVPEPTKKPTSNQYGSVDSGNAPNGPIPPYDRSLTTPEFTDPTMCYLPNGYPPSTAYYYGGYDGTGNEWDDFSRYGNAEGVDIASGFYGDNASLMYPGYGYAPYGPYSPATTPVPGNEQLYGTQHYHYPTPYFQSVPSSVPNAQGLSAPQTEVATSAPADQKPLPVETLNVNSNGPKNGAVKGNARSGNLKSTYQSPGYNANGSFGMASLPGSIASGYQGFGYDGLASPLSWPEGPTFADGQPGRVTNTGMVNSISNAKNVPSSRNQSYRPNSQVMGLHHPRPLSGIGNANGYMSRMYPASKLYSQYANTVRSGIGFGYDSRTNGRGWLGMDNKYKNRGHGGGFYGYSNENMDGLNELNRGPRAKGSKNQKSFSSVTLTVKGQNLPSDGAIGEEKSKTSETPDREEYNKEDFPEEYAEAKFFVIKSYSEDDVHKSMKYNVWASTPNGNKKLDAAYREAKEKAGACPVFLFFSVNTSGQFVGVAEMLGTVDFEKSVEYWQQDKWNGCFPVKWHIVKDVPNSLLKHIILENNENKPVTNSRDTQEIKLDQGLKMIKIFKDHSSKTCLLDDFEFYENRQKAIQEKKAKQQQYQKQMHVWEGKPMTEKKDTANGELKSSEISSDQIKESATALSDGDLKLPEDSNVAKPVVPELLANGIANAC